jgi:DNA-binding NtrC family response regulator
VIAKCAPARDTAVLIRGETGTGKELIAAHLHAQSPRADQPFVAVNCAAIPENLIESELFGHVRGAFSGAAQARRGRFVAADRGTLFLDEVADLSLAAQAKLLRVLEEGEVQVLGTDSPVTVDVRVVSATHKDLDAEIAAGRFREDLYYRLDVVTIEAQPLRERGDDVVLLAEHFRNELGPRLGNPLRGFSAAALAALRAHSWPGNVRQLRNEVERALLFADGPLIEARDLRLRGAARDDEAAWTELELNERRTVSEVLQKHEGNIQAAAQALGIARGTLYRKIEKYGLPRPAR